MLDRVGGSPKALCPQVMVPLLRLTSRSAAPSQHRGRAPHTAQRARPCWAVRDQGPQGYFRRGNDGPVLGTGWGPHSPGESPGPGGAPAGEPSSAREQRATRAPWAVCRAAGGTACSVQGTQELWSLGPERQEVWPPSQPEPPSPGFLSFKHSRDYVLVRFFFLQTGKQAQKGLLAGA